MSTRAWTAFCGGIMFGYYAVGDNVPMTGLGLAVMLYAIFLWRETP